MALGPQATVYSRRLKSDFLWEWTLFFLFPFFALNLYPRALFCNQIPTPIPTSPTFSGETETEVSWHAPATGKRERVEPVKSNGFMTVLDAVVRDVRNNKECCFILPPPLPLIKEVFVLFTPLNPNQGNQFCTKYHTSS